MKDTHLHEDTHAIVSRERVKTLKSSHHQPRHSISGRWKDAAHEIIRRTRSKAHYRNPLNISAREHMTDVDCFDGTQARTVGKTAEARVASTSNEDKTDDESDVIVVHPVVDGRLKDVGRK